MRERESEREEREREREEIKTGCYSSLRASIIIIAKVYYVYI